MHHGGSQEMLISVLQQKRVGKMGQVTHLLFQSLFGTFFGVLVTFR